MYKMRCKENDDSKENSGCHIVKLLAFVGSSSELHAKRVPGWLDYVGDDKLPIILPSYIRIYFITHGSLSNQAVFHGSSAPFQMVSFLNQFFQPGTYDAWPEGKPQQNFG